VSPHSRWLKPGPYSTATTYTDRASKTRYIAEKYAPLFGEGRRVLDVGCDRKQLQAMLTRGVEYVGIDLNPHADRIVDLDREPLPFADASFETVVCCDVLEHLARCHEVFDELCRVSSDRVILSLPNAVQDVVASLVSGQGGRVKHYGLSVEPPRDRHRWFFGFEDAAEFLTRRAERLGFEVEQLDAGTVSSVYWLIGQPARDVLDHPNVRLGTCWCVIRRSVSGVDDGLDVRR
jgi:SAM-dependent methyltransferase